MDNPSASQTNRQSPSTSSVGSTSLTTTPSLSGPPNTALTSHPPEQPPLTTNSTSRQTTTHTLSPLEERLLSLLQKQQETIEGSNETNDPNKILLSAILEDNNRETVIYVNAKQYARILKRRAARIRMNKHRAFPGARNFPAGDLGCVTKELIHQKKREGACKRKRNSTGQFI